MIWLVAALAVLATSLILRFRLYRLPRAANAGLAIAPAIVLFIAIYVLRLLGTIIAIKLLGLDIQDFGSQSQSLPFCDTVLVLLGSYLAQSIVIVVFAVLASRQVRRAKAQPRPVRMIRAMTIGALTMILSWPIIAIVGMAASAAVEWIWGTPTPPIAHEFLQRMIESPRDGSFWLAALLVTVGAAVCEEVTYRGLLQPMFRHIGLSSYTAILLTSAVFAAMHLGAAHAQAIVALFVFSLALGWARERTGSIMAPITMHLIFNAGNLTLAMLVS